MSGFNFDILNEVAAVPSDVAQSEIDREAEDSIEYAWGRPGNMVPFRTHPENHAEAYFLEHRIGKDSSIEYLIANPELCRKYQTALKKRHLHTWISDTGLIGVWAVSSSKGNPFTLTGTQATTEARTKWVMTNTRSGGGWTVMLCDEDFGEPAWPEKLPGVLSLAGRALGLDRIILDKDHELIRRIGRVITVVDQKD